MKKTLLLLAALCCAVMSWAGWVQVEENPLASFSQITDIQLDSATFNITFVDNYAPNLTFHTRHYNIFFLEINNDTHWYKSTTNSNVAAYGTYDGVHDPVRSSIITGYSNGVSVFNFNGGEVQINCQKSINKMFADGFKQFMVTIECSYQLTSTDPVVYYSCSSNAFCRDLSNAAVIDMPNYTAHTVEFYYNPTYYIKNYEPLLYKSYSVLDGLSLDMFYEVPENPETEFVIEGWYDLDRDQERLDTVGVNKGRSQLSYIFAMPIDKDYKFMAGEMVIRANIYKEDDSPGQVGYLNAIGGRFLGNINEPMSFGSSMLIIAVPDEGAYFYGWSDGSMEMMRTIYFHRHTRLDAYFGKTPISYPITVGGISVTQENQSDVLGDGGSVQYDPTRQQLNITDYVSIDGGAGSGITFDGSGYINPNFTIHMESPFEITAKDNGIKTTAANLTIDSKTYRTDMLGIESDREALSIDGDLTFKNTRVYAFANHAAAVKLTFHTMSVDSSLVLMNPASGVPTCSGISELNMINAKFLTEGVSFSKTYMSIVDDETGTFATKQVSIKPFVTYPLTIGGVAVTSDNSNDVLGDGGSVVYNADEGTIYVHKDVTIENETGNGITFDGECYIILLADCNIQAKGYGIEATKGLTIQTTKENSHTLNIESDKEAIKSAGGDCTLINPFVSAVSAQASAIDLSDNDLALINSNLYMANKSNSEAVCKGVNLLYTRDCYIETKGVSFSDEKKGLVDDATGLLTTNPVTIKKGSEPTDIHTISNDANAATYQKFLHNGVLYIQKNGQIYSVMGERIQ